MKSTISGLLAASLLMALTAHGTPAPTSAAEPPVAARKPHSKTIHGEVVNDDYFWLREKANPEVIRYLEAENTYSETALATLKPLREQLYKEMLGRIKQTDLSVPFRSNGYAYYARTVEGKQYPIRYRKKIDANGQFEASSEEVLLDLNQLAEGKKFMSVGATAVSPNNQWLAYSTDETGFRQYTLHIKNLKTGEVASFKRERVTSFDWAGDEHLFYVTEDATTKRSDQLYRHRLGNTKDTLLIEEKDALYNIAVRLDRSRQYLFLTSESFSTTEVRYLRADRPEAEWQMVAPRQKGREYGVDYHDGHFYLRVNDTGRNFRLVKTPVDKLDPKHWQEVVAHRPNVMIAGVDLFKHYLVRTERENGLPQLHITDLRNGNGHRLPFPEAVYSAGLSQNDEWDVETLRYRYQSFTTPNSVYDYQIAKRESKLLKRQEVLGDFDPSRYQAERRYAKAEDGTEIPISVVYRKGTKLDGTAPMLLTGYGAYGIPSNVGFSSNRLSLLDRGAIFAIAHIRGGGDLGKPWHDAGKLLNKKNSFTDFISAAEFLVKEKFTAPDRLVASGGSAGGLLMGAITNLRPDLFKAIVSHVPFVDVMNTMLDASLPLTVAEYEEWGNPNEKPYYDYMKSYSPYDNLKRGAYPALLVKTSLNDSQVMYWEPAKYVARLRTLKTDRNPLLLVTNMGAGHGGASGRYDRLREDALDYAFLLQQMGLVK